MLDTPSLAMIYYPDASTCLQNASPWSCWWAGFQLGSNVYFLWWSITAWARVGKVPQFVAGAFILVEIVGPAKLGAWSQKLAHLPTPFRSLKLSPGRIGSWARVFFTSLPKVMLVLSFIFAPVVAVWFLLVRLGLLTAPRGAGSLFWLSLADRLAAIVVSPFAFAGIAALFVLISYSIVIGGATIIVARLTQLLSFLVGHPQLLPRAKFAGWAIFVVWFWLDFLAS